MYKLFLSILSVGILVFCFSRDQPQGTPIADLKTYQEADKLFKQATQLSKQGTEDEATQLKIEELYRQALIQFKKIAVKNSNPAYDSLAFFIHIKIGFAEYFFDSTEAAKKEYLAAINLKKKLPVINDSFLFAPLLYTGAIYYSQNQFDSAVYFYKKAEQINDLYKKSLPESQRLYNRLGVIYYETGNYRQARNYFEKAISTLNNSEPQNKTLFINYQINIASLSVKLEEFTTAQEIYESILPANIFPDEINHNLGIINLKLKKYPEAINYFKKVNYDGNKKIIDLYYNFGATYTAMNETDSADVYFHKALAENLRWNGHKKNLSYGLILKQQGDELTGRRQYKEAAVKYQEAIIQFDNNFNDPVIYKNPQEYSGIFSYINLFNTLVAKATVLELLYYEEKNITLLESSLDAFRSAFSLASYVEKTYNSDEARLFLGKIKYTVHSKPIEISLQLYELTKKRSYLEEAYFFDQRNKASVLAFNAEENELQKQDGVPIALLEKQTSLKNNITRLSLKASQVSDSLQLVKFAASIRDYEMELGKNEEQIRSSAGKTKNNSIGQIPSVHQLQKRLDNTTALLSYHLSDNRLVTLLITANQFEYRSLIINKNFFTEIQSFKDALQNTGIGENYTGAVSSLNLYQALIAPVDKKLLRMKRLIVIPDDELSYLPFEALQDENNNYLVEKFSVQYQYSTSLLAKKEHTIYAPNTVAFAPFASYNYSDSSGTTINRLPASAEEVSNLTGTVFMDTIASKANFLKAANHFGTIHLATHASVNNDQPFQTFISFNPVQNDYKLYAEEIYNLNLDSTQLVILSACETGSGKLVKGEGLMSLSRAFAYAGCPNIITSLWKAEDKTTSFITQRLHYYLEEKYSKDEALQKAKIDLLHSNAINPGLKIPTYWSHLILIGDYEPHTKSNNWKWVALCVIVLLLGYHLLKKKNLTFNPRQAGSS